MVFVDTVAWRSTAPSDDYVRIFVTPMRGGVAVSDPLPLCSATWDINGRYQFINKDGDSIKLQVEDLLTGELIAYVNGAQVRTFGPCPASTLTWTWTPRAAPTPTAALPSFLTDWRFLASGAIAAGVVAVVVTR